MKFRPLHALYLELDDVLDLKGLVGVEGLPESGADEGAVVGILGLHQGVEILPSGKISPAALAPSNWLA